MTGKLVADKQVIERDEGWALLPRAAKMHYFRGGLSLCNGWAYFFNYFDSPDTPGAPHHCKACERKRAKERK